jgi:hypothetical protein
MCLAPSMPSPPAPPAPPPMPVIAPGTQPTTIRPTKSTRESIAQASKGTSNLAIPLSIGGMTPMKSPLSIGGMNTAPNLSIGK